MSRLAKVNLFKFFRQTFFRIFCGFNVGFPDDVDVLHKLAEIFDSSEPRISASIKLYAYSLTKSFAIFQDIC